RLSRNDKVAWIGDYQPAYKLSPLTHRDQTSETTYDALLFPDADLASVRAAVAATGLRIDEQTDNGINKLLRFHATGPALARVAAREGVAGIEPVLPLRVENDNAQWVVQTNASGNRRIWTMGIVGAGQVVMTSDTGINTSHDQFRDPSNPIVGFGDFPTNRKIIAYKPGSTDPNVAFGDHSGASFHGTHTAGTLMGSDDAVGGTSLRDGMAKDAKIYFMDISGPALANTVVPFQDLNDLFLPPYLGNTGGAARISSNSWGSAVAGA